MNEKTQDNGDAHDPETALRTTRSGLSRRSVLIAGGLGLAALAGGAAMVGRRLLRPAVGEGGAGNDIMIAGGAPGMPAGGQVRQFIRPIIKHAPELPAGEPTVNGLYKRRHDKSVFLGTGNVEMMIQIDGNNKPNMKASSDGPEVEVVFTRDTVIYEDITVINMEDAQASKEMQQVVAPMASLDALTDKLSDVDGLAVWGDKVGDRYIARTVVYRPPMLPDGLKPLR